MKSLRSLMNVNQGYMLLPGAIKLSEKMASSPIELYAALSALIPKVVKPTVYWHQSTNFMRL